MKLSDLKSYKVIAAPVAPTPPEKDLLSQATDVATTIFPGTKAIGESLGTAALNIGKLARGQNPDIPVNVPATVGGYVAAGASALGTMGAGATGGVLTKALQSAGVGAAIGGGSAVSEGKRAGEAVGAAALGAGVGAGTSLAFSGGAQVLKGIRALPERFVRSATGQSKKEILAGKDISKYVIENKRIGTSSQLIKSSQEAIDSANDFINQSLGSVTNKTVPVKDIVSDITSAINGAGGDIDEAGVRSVLERLAPQVRKTLGAETLTLSEANQLRSQLDKVLKPSAFISSQLPFDRGILMDFANALREQVKGAAPTGTRAAFDTLSKEITLRNLILAKSAQGSRNQIIGLGDLLSGGFGAAAGGIPGAIVAAGAKRVAESPLTKTTLAVSLDSLDKTLSPILDSLEPAARTAVVNAIVQAISGSQSEPQ